MDPELTQALEVLQRSLRAELDSVAALSLSLRALYNEVFARCDETGTLLRMQRSPKVPKAVLEARLQALLQPEQRARIDAAYEALMRRISDAPTEARKEAFLAVQAHREKGA